MLFPFNKIGDPFSHLLLEEIQNSLHIPFTFRRFTFCLFSSRTTSNVEMFWVSHFIFVFLNLIEKEIENDNLCLEKLQFKFKRKIRTCTGIWTSDLQVPILALHHFEVSWLQYTFKLLFMHFPFRVLSSN